MREKFCLLIKLEGGNNLIKKVRNSYDKIFAVRVGKASKIDNKSCVERVATYFRTLSKVLDGNYLKFLELADKPEEVN